MKQRFVLTGLLLGALLFFSTCKKNPVAPRPAVGPDTTSHNFTFTQYTFGGSGGSSFFKDVAIVSDTDIWAVGAIYTDSATYNAAHWDGKAWKLTKIQFVGPCSAVLYPNLQAVWVFGSNNILVTNGGSIVHFDGTNAVMDCGMNALLTGAINRIFATSPQSIYLVGNSGAIVYYNGSSWTQMQSGTTVDLRDVWGSPDGSVVWACGFSNDQSESILLKFDGLRWTTVWNRFGASFTPPYGYFVTSVWGMDSLILSSGRGVFGDTLQVATLPWFPYRIRGNSDNNIGVAGDEGMIWHWNGVDWKQLNLQSGQPLYSIAVSQSVIAAVGVDNSIGFGAALIYLGKRE